MSIYSIDNKPQSPIGHGEHWRLLFQKFQNTQLHKIIIEELEVYIEKCSKSSNSRVYINSAFAACEILPKLETLFPEIIEKCPYGQRAGLLGMVLWHWLANSPERWYFYNDDSGIGDGKVYFRSQV
ncbi:hypothetical protein U27_02992 [Candidatus Vecturithrix granuli]|uniref:Uncharacterized protein n=1 Tax=Vecturithrix granuli TaxID=1499967 RepID=A0A081BUM5_VECG1|nr:hypothetical protein U27_02992 [Candidatus Vecturithrix granuli]